MCGNDVWRCGLMSVVKGITKLAVLAGLLVGLIGCSQSFFRADIKDYAAQNPALKLEQFFEGRSYAYGIFEDRFGNLKRQFRVRIDGTVSADGLRLDERFIYDDGEMSRRVWTIENKGEDEDGLIRYEGRAQDVEGQATGRIAGNVLAWSYDIVLSLSGQEVKVRFDDFIYQLDDDIALNRAFVSKWGVEIGSVTLVFLRGDTAAKMPEMNLMQW